MQPAPYEQLDTTDRLIVDFLRRDGRMPYREIARRIGVSESMVRKRVNRLLEGGWMRILAISDPLQLGVPILATTYLKVSPWAVEEVTDSITRSRAVRYVAVGVGSYNVVVESLHANNSELHHFIQQELGLEGIISSETMQVVAIKKSVWDWEIPSSPRSNPATHGSETK
ncbi:MAG: Lrp/AsnC family transcriptional regulator [Trueperaceae bacterium]